MAKRRRSLLSHPKGFGGRVPGRSVTEPVETSTDDSGGTGSGDAHEPNPPPEETEAQTEGQGAAQDEPALEISSSAQDESPVEAEQQETADELADGPPDESSDMDSEEEFFDSGADVVEDGEPETVLVEHRDETAGTPSPAASETEVEASEGEVSDDPNALSLESDEEEDGDLGPLSPTEEVLVASLHAFDEPLDQYVDPDGELELDDVDDDDLAGFGESYEDDEHDSNVAKKGDAPRSPMFPGYIDDDPPTCEISDFKIDGRYEEETEELGGDGPAAAANLDEFASNDSAWTMVSLVVAAVFLIWLLAGGLG